MWWICEDCWCSSNECECPEEKEDFIENYIPKINLLYYRRYTITS